MSTVDERPSGAPSRIADVARLAGVSSQTVSNVINGRRGFTEQTRQRVMAAVEQLHYRPNQPARSLRTSRTMQIGYHLSGHQLDARNPFAIAFLRGLVKAGAAAGYQVVVFTQPEDSAHGFRDLVAKGIVDGFVLSDCQAGDPRTKELADLGVPFAAFGRTSPELPQTWVDIDNATAMATIVDYLAAGGHRSFGYVGHDDGFYWARGAAPRPSSPAATTSRLRCSASRRPSACASGSTWP